MGFLRHAARFAVGQTAGFVLKPEQCNRAARQRFTVLTGVGVGVAVAAVALGATAAVHLVKGGATTGARAAVATAVGTGAAGAAARPSGLLAVPAATVRPRHSRRRSKAAAGAGWPLCTPCTRGFCAAHGAVRADGWQGLA